MSSLNYAIIMAGGHGERFWPASTVERPKQLLQILHDNKSFLQESVYRINHIIEQEHVLIATSPVLKDAINNQLPFIPTENIITEPHKRNTLGCIIWSTAHLIAKHPDEWKNITLAILTADHYISPTEKFCELVQEILNFVDKTIAWSLSELRQTDLKLDTAILRCNLLVHQTRTF